VIASFLAANQLKILIAINRTIKINNIARKIGQYILFILNKIKNGSYRYRKSMESPGI